MQTTSTSAPIGIFDSGVGGLSVYQAVRQSLPFEDIIYLADSGHAPYGERSRDFISERAFKLSRFLLEQGAKAIVVACNTATVVSVERLRQHFTLPIIALEPAIKPAIECSRSGTVGVLATRRTLESPAVEHLCRAYGQGRNIILQACPGFVEQVELGQMHSPATLALVEQYVAPLRDAGADTLVLGCTHYAYLQHAIQQKAGAQVRLLDSASAVARQVTRRLHAISLANHYPRQAQDQFFTTAHDVHAASEVMSILLAHKVEVKRASI
ncbi:MAG TPA: glutamate racemase [bacterium]|nr:glutamate racemase [bacterium]